MRSVASTRGGSLGKPVADRTARVCCIPGALVACTAVAGEGAIAAAMGVGIGLPALAGPASRTGGDALVVSSATSIVAAMGAPDAFSNRAGRRRRNVASAGAARSTSLAK
jgi:hypothetical protein